MSLHATARRVEVHTDAQTLVIDWADGHQTVYPLDGLRRACPCASCQGHEHLGELPDPAVFRVPALMRWAQLRLEPVGHYALRFHWDDGHNTGLYTWQRLRAMCPCAVCQPLP
jgi:DUF971 family protein